MLEDNLDHEMAAVSLASSDALMEQAKEGRDLVKLQTEIHDSIDRVEAVKKALGEVQPKDVTQLFGTIVDRQLDRVGIRSFGDENEVAGLESLGLGLTPARYLETRIDACESFISDFADWSKRVTKRFFSDILEQLASLREDHDSLSSNAKILQDRAKDDNTLFGRNEFTLGPGSRVLLMNGKLPSDLVAQLTRFVATTRAITTNFYRINQANTNEIISYFGGFAGASQEEAQERLLMLPGSLSRYQFKEAMFAIREESNDVYETRGSVELLGDRRYVNSFLKDRSKRDNYEALQQWLELYRKHERIQLKKGKFQDGDITMKGLSRAETEKALKCVFSTLADVEALFKQGDRYLIDGQEYKKMLAMLNNSEWDEPLKVEIGNAFTTLILTRNNEQVQVRADMVKYTTLVMSAMLLVCESSME